MTHARPTRTFAEACESVLREPDGEHSLYTTLAPLYDRMVLDAEEQDDYERHLRTLARHVPQTAETVLDVGCGVGGFLPFLEARFQHVVGVDAHAELLGFAARRAGHAMLVDGDVTDTDCALDRHFDAVVSLDSLTARFTDDELLACFETVREHLEPDGVFVFDVVVDPVAVAEDAVGVYTGEGYRLERAVDVAPKPALPGVELRVDYRVTDIGGDRRATTKECISVRTFDVETVESALSTAGFGRIAVERDAGDEGTVVVVAQP
ncbi:class I SAM-dependent DNA methyltransferase [Halogranum rubrum]|uniref:Methyltransferase domain-containing protein n=1 Tax=Halogranum salarium B-1 TaxID=1210908 RepID=J3JFC2_9EURY|nr:class I SAM-dependent methyltransferase [Halogranum salarium]EJN59124.1 hypothetical protein HSB1_25450 [Halogranum salarium B-1]